MENEKKSLIDFVLNVAPQAQVTVASFISGWILGFILLSFRHAKSIA